MVNPELVEYIRTCISKGIPPAKIMKLLYEAGWDDLEIDEAFVKAFPKRPTTPPTPPFQSPAQTPKPTSPSWPLTFKSGWLVAGMIFVIAVVGLMLLIPGKEGSHVDDMAKPANLEQPTSMQELNDCGSNLGCFILSAEECSPAKVRSVVPVEILGLKVYETLEMEIVGERGGKCGLKLRELESKLSPESIAKLFSQGVSEEELNQKEEEVRAELKNALSTMTCYYNISELLGMLNRWKQGEFALEDWTLGECEPIEDEQASPSCNLATEPSYVDLPLGEVRTIEATGFAGDGSSISWASDNPSIVVLQNIKGKSIKVKGKAYGAAHIIATDDSIGIECKAETIVEVI
ncbi:Ig-like domain-containing protein [Candidatus Woesearchaeota archaeon]|nr:Ig-like domain-containing protein [Candidatus Woesearchaeota archaeon]